MPPISTKLAKKSSSLWCSSSLSKSSSRNPSANFIDYSDRNEDLIYTLADLCDYSFQFYSDYEIKLTVSEIHILLGLFSKVQKCIFSETIRHVILIISSNGFIDTVKAYLLILAEEGEFSMQYNWNIFFSNLLNYFKCLTKLNYNTLSKFRKLDRKVKTSLIITKELLCELIKYKHIICMPSLIEETDVLLNFFLSSGKPNLRSDFENTIFNPYPSYLDIYTSESSKFSFNPYETIENYFKYQFLLLKEDYLCIIRDGLNQYRNEARNLTEKKKNFNIYAYKSVTFLDYVLDPTSHRKIGLKIIIEDDSQLRVARNRKSKRFLFGSLLLFSRNDFDTFFIGLVKDRRLLEEGECCIEVILIEPFPEDVIRSSFAMVEIAVFFEPYYQVLNCLKTLTSVNYSMGNYLVSDEMVFTRPKYLSLSCNYDIFGYKVPVCCAKAWPSAFQLNLDQFQFEALKTALTNQFTLIQGPPGTGKTYLGLKIVEILLNNWKQWNIPPSPILVICYTNHALDQFLEGALPMTNKIVRIGGQSKSKILEPYNLRYLWKKPFKKMEGLLNLRTNIKQIIATSVISISNYRKTAELINKNFGILHIDLIKTVLTHEHKEYLNCEDVFLSWLLSDNSNCQSSIVNDETKEETPGSQCRNVLRIESKYAKYIKDLKELEKVLKFQLSLIELESKLIYLSEQIESKRVADLTPQEIKSLLSNISNFISELTVFKHLEKKLCNSVDRFSTDDLKNVDLKSLQPIDRWRAYFTWQDEVARQMNLKFKEAIVEHNGLCQFFKEACDMEDYVNIKQFGTHVIGITTTGAARYNTLLSLLKPKIVIIEEAAEILEAHTVTSLTRNCQHVIMIGDHYQLRPSTASYELAKEFKLDISLFERLLKRGMPVHTLRTQRRMRPEISSLVTPFIYKHLEDHLTVYDYPDVKGIKKNLFFLDHRIYEDEVADSHSHKNIHEADFLLSLCSYLIKQGYDPVEITILTTYLAQEHYMIQKRNADKMLKDVRITVVDNYQGEENNIILLSLVRSNSADNIGYLTSRNRMCVALTRARYGMFIVGNMECLTRGSELWKKLHTSLLKTKSFGDHLELVCKTHGNVTPVSLKSDLSKIKQGGCEAACNFQLPCGHMCPKMCHGININHMTMKCRERCNRLCVEGHPCQLYCFEECDTCDQCNKLTNQSQLQNTSKLKNKPIYRKEPDEMHPPSNKLFENGNDFEVESNPDSDCELNVDLLLRDEDSNKNDVTNKGQASDICNNKISGLADHSSNEKIIIDNTDFTTSDDSIKNINESPVNPLPGIQLNDIDTENDLEKPSSIVEGVNDDKMQSCIINSDVDVELKQTLIQKSDKLILTMASDCKIDEEKHLSIINGDECNLEVQPFDISHNNIDCNVEANVIGNTNSNYNDLIKDQIKILMTPQNKLSLTSINTQSLPSAEKILSISETYKSLNISSFEISDTFFTQEFEEKMSITSDVQIIDGETANSFEESFDSKELLKAGSEHAESTAEDFYHLNDTKETIIEIDCLNSIEPDNETDTIFQHENDDVRTISLPTVADPCTRVLPCGHNCCKDCGKQSCQTTRCEKMVRINLLCNHVRNIRCYLSQSCSEGKIVAESLLEQCEEKCGQELECGHTCQGTCSGCSQGRIHQKCFQLCDKMLICGHKCTMYCWEDIHTCVEICGNKCSHQDCSSRCKEECNTCQEKCSWSCEHYTCTALCGELCNRPLCMLGCKLLLPCGHPCTGFCGEPCPPFCFECDPSDNYSPFIHRFLLLEECGHYFEWSQLYSDLRVHQVSLKRCPTCGVEIWSTLRLKNIIIGTNSLIRQTLRSEMPESVFNVDMKNRILQTFNMLKEFISEEVLFINHFQLLLQYTIDNMSLIMNGVRNDQRILLKSLLFVQVYLLEMSKFTTSYDIFKLRKHHRQLIFLRINLFLKQLYRRKEISSLEFFQFECESLKIHRMAEFFILYEEYFTRIKNTHKDTQEIQALCHNGFNVINSVRSYSLTDDYNFFNNIYNFKNAIGSSLKLTVDTRLFKQALKNSLLPIFTRKHCHDGTWFLCPNGHPFSKNDLFNNQCDKCI